MRKHLASLIILLLLGASAMAQTVQVTGIVTDSLGGAISGASVRERGTRNGVSAGADGNFRITVRPNATLIISAVGFNPREVAASSNVSVALTSNAGTTDEVIVTALGIRRKPKELGYAAQTIRSEAITAGSNPNLANSLSGKISGLVVFNVNSSIQADTRIVLRGNRSITGNNQALVVLDGVPVPQNTLTYLNPNDIQDISVLKGGQAATLYGSDGVNGVIIVTTKKGSKGRSQVAVTSSLNAEQVSFLPKFQNDFGSGSGYGYDPVDNYRSYENQSYGDRYDGSRRPLGRAAFDSSVFYAPYSALPNEKRKVWDLGSVMQNDVSVSGGDETSTFYLALQDVLTKGIVPGDQKRRDAFRFNAAKQFGKFKASFQTSYAQDNFNRTNSDFYFFVINTAANVPLTQLRNWKTDKFASPNGYYNDYYNNPWFELDNNRYIGRNNYFNGSAELNYAPVDWFNATYRIGTAVTNTEEKFTTGQFIYSNWAKNGAFVPAPFPNDYSYIFRARTDILGGVTDRNSNAQRINSDLILSFRKKVGRFNGNLVVGNNLQQRRSDVLSVNSTSIVIPELFNIANRTGELGGSQTVSKLRRYGYYGDLTVGYNDWLFAHGSFRRDGSSVFFQTTRPTNLYTYNYYGADVSIVLTDAIPGLKNDVLNYAKIRGGFNRNANDNIDPYSLSLTYGIGGGFPYGSLAGTTVGNTLPDSALKPEFITTYEGGLELGFFNSRINLDFSAYHSKSVGQVISVALARPTGFAAALINAGEVQNWGYEAEAKTQVIKNRNWSWDVNLNYGFTNNTVKSLYGNLQQVGLGTSFTESGGVVTAQTFAALDNPFPLIKVTDFNRTADGKIIVSKTTGYPSLAAQQVVAGNSSPKHMLGITSVLRYKNLSLTATAEYRGGYVVYHGLGSSMTFTGVGYVTAQYGRENFIIPNSVYDDGTGKYVDNTSIPVADGHYYYWDQLFKFAGKNFVTNGAFWKIREVNLSYSLPRSLAARTKVFKGASLSLIGRNLVTFVPKDNYYTDPEFANTTGNGIGINSTTNTPPVRSYGATLNLTF